jgi:mRNA interferase MazF
MGRAEIWWAELPPPVGSRPVVILPRDAVLGSIGSVVVGPVTRTRRGVETEVPLGGREGLPCPSVVNLDNILTVPRQRLTRQMSSLSREKVDQLNQAIKTWLGIPS